MSRAGERAGKSLVPAPIVETTSLPRAPQAMERETLPNVAQGGGKAAMEGPVSPPPVAGGVGNELPAYMSNGVVGLKVRDNPLTPGMTLLSGFSGEHPERKIEAAAFAPYPTRATSAWAEFGCRTRPNMSASSTKPTISRLPN
jgi:hypothetical protein